MYWFRSGSWFNLLPWTAVMILVFWGGWLLVYHVFGKRRPLDAFLGFGLGLVLYLWSVNLVGRWLDPVTAFVGCGLLVLLAGLLAARGDLRLPYREALRAGWPLLLLGLVMFWMFLRVSKGLGLFDEYKNLALVSVIANGELPVRDVAGQDNPLRYHYGFHLLGASLMRLGGMMPWSAFDFAKALVWGYAAVLSWLLGRRIFERSWGGAAGLLTILFSSGTRYLLLLLPSDLLIQADKLIDLAGATAQSAGSFFEAMTGTYLIDAGPPIPYPLAYQSGIRVPLVLGHGGDRLLAGALLLLFVLFYIKDGIPRKPAAIGVLALFLSFWALTAEAAYAVLGLGIGLSLATAVIRARGFRQLDPALTALALAGLLSLPIAFLQGGTLSAMVLKQAAELQIADTLQAGSSFSSFSLRWPPALVSAHLGEIPLSSLLGWLIAVLEAGVIVILLVPVSIWAARQAGRGEFHSGLLLGAVWVGLLFPVFFRWEVDRDIARITSFGLEVLSILVLLYWGALLRRGGGWEKWGAALAAGLTALSIYGGLMLNGVQLTAAQQTVLAHRYDPHDGEVLSQVWGTLPADSKAFGLIGKMSILTGHLSGGIYNPPYGQEREIWDGLIAAPTLEGLVAGGYEFVYADQAWFRQIPESSQDLFDAECVRLAAGAENEIGSKFTRIYDLRACFP
jgi:hypothetical protein